MNLINSLTEHFKPYLQWHKSHLDALSILIVAIIKRRTVNWTELATTFPGTAETSSCYRRIQRFFKDVAFDETLIAQLIAHLFAPEGAWMLAMRTHQQLLLIICKDGRSKPCFKLSRDAASIWKRHI